MDLTKMTTEWFNECALFVDENKRQIQFGLYTLAFTGFGYALKSVRPLKKFHNAHEIPQTFINRHLTLNGNVIGVDSQAPVVYVEHNPIINTRFHNKSNPGLAVHISGINVTSNGVSWLEHMLMRRCVHFTLLKLCNNRISSIVYLNRMNIAEELLNLGFATVDVIDFDLEQNKLYVEYYQRLLLLEEKAEKKKVGVWADPDSCASFGNEVKDKLMNLFYKWYYKLKK